MTWLKQWGLMLASFTIVLTACVKEKDQYIYQTFFVNNLSDAPIRVETRVTFRYAQTHPLYSLVDVEPLQVDSIKITHCFKRSGHKIAIGPFNASAPMSYYASGGCKITTKVTNMSQDDAYQWTQNVYLHHPKVDTFTTRYHWECVYADTTYQDRYDDFICVIVDKE